MWIVKIRPVRTISRKGQVLSNGSSGSSTARDASRSVVRNPGCRLGWQVQHEFAVTQAASSRAALELLGEVFRCGVVIEQHRTDNHR